MLSEHDDWNDELVYHYENDDGPLRVRFMRENMQLGRAGLHRYFNDCLLRASGDWIIYFCEDHFITGYGWDLAMLHTASGQLLHGDSKEKQFPLDPAEPWVIVPKFDNCGAMNHMVSRGFVDALGGVIGNHGWIDSYINDLMREFPDRVIRMDDPPMFHDFTHDQPSPMSDSHVQALSTVKGDMLPKYESDKVARLLESDRERIRKSLRRNR